MAKVVLPAWPTSPPLETLRAGLERHGQWYRSTRLAYPKNEREALESFGQFLRGSRDNLRQRPIGNATDLAAAYSNTVSAKDATETSFNLLLEFEQPPLMNARTQVAALNVIVAAQTVNSSLLTHIRANHWYECATLSLLRTALELAAIAGHVALATGNEPVRWYEGANLADPKERQAAEFKKVECCRSIEPLIANNRGDAASPVVVYRWLSRFTHLDATAIECCPTHAHAYAALAYVSWICAVVAELVTGLPELATYPSRWPASLPW